MNTKERFQNIEVLENAVQRSVKILLDFDRLPNNSDKDLLKDKVSEQLQRNGCLTFVIFACLDWQPNELRCEQPEKFIADVVRNQDLFAPRIKKINQIQQKLSLENIGCNLVMVMGDTDVEDYFKLILDDSGIVFDEYVLFQRKERYMKSFAKRIKEQLQMSTTVIRWSEKRGSYNFSVDIPKDILSQEAERMKQAYLMGRNFKDLNLKVSDNTFQKSAKRKIELYARQGKMAQETFEAILLQTETPWFEVTQQLKLAGPRLVVIYPWVRKEEL